MGNGGIFDRQSGLLHGGDHVIKQLAPRLLAVFQRQIERDKIEIQRQGVRHGVDRFPEFRTDAIPQQLSDVDLRHGDYPAGIIIVKDFCRGP